MKVNLKKTFEDLSGEEVKQGPGHGGKPEDALTVKEALIMALSHTRQDQNGTQKFESYKLLRKIEKMEDEEGEFTAEEIVKLKEIVGHYPFVVVVHGQLIEALDPNS